MPDLYSSNYIHIKPFYKYSSFLSYFNFLALDTRLLLSLLSSLLLSLLFLDPVLFANGQSITTFLNNKLEINQLWFKFTQAAREENNMT